MRKSGLDSLNVIIHAGLIGLLLIVAFLVVLYRVSGLMAGFNTRYLWTWPPFIIEMFQESFFTLASIAGIILSIRSCD